MRKTKIICLICALSMVLGAANAFAIGLNTVYDGTNTMTIDATSTYTDADGNTVPTMTMTQVDGNYGKLAGDKVYKYSGFSTTSGGGSDYIGMWQGNFDKSYAVQTQLCLTDQTNTVDYQLGYFYVDTDTTQYQNGNLFRITASSGAVTVSNPAMIAESEHNTVLTTLEKNRWYNIDVYLPIDGTVVYVYINGVEYTINLTSTMYGIRHFRISTGKGYSGDGSSATDVPFVAYMDNVSCIATTAYDSTEDRVTALTSDTYAISGNEIALNTIDASASEVLEGVSAESGRIRLYSDAAMTTQIAGDEAVTENSVLVVATLTDNAETAYNYYTFTFPNAESNMYSGTQTITLSEGGNASSGTGSTLYPDAVRALTYPTAGTGGKKVSDSTYLWGGKTCGSGGHWYMNIGTSSASNPAYIFEITFKLDEGSTGFAYGPAPFIKDAEGATTSKFANTYPFRFTLEDGAYMAAVTSGDVTAYSFDSTNNVFKEGSRSIKFGDIEPGRWHTFAMVTYADGTSDFDVYFDGVKTELDWNFNPGNMRHVRMYAYASDDQKVYFDNMKSYGVSVDTAKAYTCRDTKEEVEFIGYELSDKTVTDVMYGTTAADIKNSIVTDGTVRIYTDDTFTTLMADSDEVTEKTMVVVASRNGTAYERALDYYSIGIAADYDELTAKTRITELAITDADGNAIASGDTAEGEYYVTFTAKNLEQSTAAEMTVAIAIYDTEDTLVDIAIKKISAPAAATTTVTVADGVKIANTLDAGSVRAYVWYADSQQPFTQSAEISF